LNILTLFIQKNGKVKEGRLCVHGSFHNFIFCWPCISLWFLVNDQPDAQFFSMYLFQFSTYFQQPRARHQENQLYQYNLWYTSLCVGDRFMCRSERNSANIARGYLFHSACFVILTCIQNSHWHRVTYTRKCIDTIDSPDEHGVAWNK